MTKSRSQDDELAVKYVNASSEQQERFLEALTTVQGWIELNKLKSTLEKHVNDMEKDRLKDTLSERLKFKEAIRGVDHHKNVTMDSLIHSDEKKQIEIIHDAMKRLGAKDVSEFKIDLGKALNHESNKKLTQPNQALMDLLKSAIKSIDSAVANPKPEIRPDKSISDPLPRRNKM